MPERHFAEHAELDAWMKKKGVTEAEVIAWVKGPSLWTYVTKRLKSLLGRKVESPA